MDFKIWKNSWVQKKSVSDTQYSFIVNEIKYIYVASSDRIRGMKIHGIVEVDGAKHNNKYPDIMNVVQQYLH